MQIRIATLADAPALARLQEAFDGPPVTPEDSSAWMLACQGLETVILAEVDDQAVGFAALRLIPSISAYEPFAQLTELYVEEGFRRHGVGRALVRYVETLARTRGATTLILLTSFTNKVAQTLYRELGYTDYELAMYRQLDTQQETE